MDQEIQPLIESIRIRSKGDLAASGTVALLSVIPYAGGAVASILGEFASQRRFEKVCEVLSDLNSRLERHGADPENHLSKDQIVQVVHETLQTASTTSDDEKMAALKEGLGYAFLSGDSFERKELFLQLLRGTTALELKVLPVVYGIPDPFVITEGGPPLEEPMPLPQSATLMVNIPNQYQGRYEPVGNREQPGAKTLLAFLADETGIEEGILEGALRLLDGKGLTNAGPNLHRSDSKVVRWFPWSQDLTANALLTNSVVAGRVADPSPLESSRTRFGEEFMRLCCNG